MFRTLTRWLRGKPTPAPVESKEPALAQAGDLAPASEESHSHPVAYDENLLERSRTQWQFGDWASLAKLERSTLQHHPDRAKLALLAAAGHQQLGNLPAVRQFTQLALDWGCGKKLASQLLIAGVHYTLGRAAEIGSQQHKARLHFEKSLSIIEGTSDISLWTKTQTAPQLPTIKEITKKSAKHHPEETFTSHTNLESSKNNSLSDAKIEEFIADLAPFFYNRAITYVDVGAFVGEVLLAITESKKIKIREAHLFEPNPKSFERLKSSIEKTNIPSVHAYKYAIGIQSGERQFSSARSMTKMVSANLEQSYVSSVFTSACISLDEAAKNFTDQHIDILKIDVEGVEIAVLSGATRLLSEQRVNVIYIEAGFNKDGTQQTYFLEIEKLLNEYDYRAFRIYEQKNEWIQDSPLLRRCNFAYMSSKFANANPYKSTIQIYRLMEEISALKSALLPIKKS